MIRRENRGYNTISYFGEETGNCIENTVYRLSG
jgi:hypothetical protein